MGLRCIVWEPRLLRGALGKKSFDFWLPDAGIVIEVDGAQHTDTAIRRKAACQQMQRDLLYTEAALAAGYMLVRLHEWDEAHWQATVQAALEQAALAAEDAKALGQARELGQEREQGKVYCFLHLTPHYFGETGWLEAWLTSHGPLGSPGGPGCV